MLAGVEEKVAYGVQDKEEAYCTNMHSWQTQVQIPSYMEEYEALCTKRLENYAYKCAWAIQEILIDLYTH